MHTERAVDDGVENGIGLGLRQCMCTSKVLHINCSDVCTDVNVRHSNYIEGRQLWDFQRFFPVSNI